MTQEQRSIQHSQNAVRVKAPKEKEMAMIAGVAACCACSTLATYQETNKAMLAARERTNQTEPQKKFDWEENSARLRKLASSAQETETDY